jgi:hypothetical protein
MILIMGDFIALYESKWTTYLVFKDRRTKFVLRDKPNPSIYEFNNINKNLCYVYKVDGGIISSTECYKCDFLLLDSDSNNAYFIELKGIDKIHALEDLLQILGTQISI